MIEFLYLHVVLFSIKFTKIKTSDGNEVKIDGYIVCGNGYAFSSSGVKAYC